MTRLLDKQIANLEEEILKHIQQDEELQPRFELLKTPSGIGGKTVAALLIDLSELGTCNPQRIAALAGMTPINADSGKHKGIRHMRGGRCHLRAAMFMPTMSATRGNPTLKAFYDRLVAAGKSKRVAQTAVIRKMLVILNTMIVNNTPWRNQQST